MVKEKRQPTYDEKLKATEWELTEAVKALPDGEKTNILNTVWLALRENGIPIKRYYEHNEVPYEVKVTEYKLVGPAEYEKVASCAIAIQLNKTTGLQNSRCGYNIVKKREGCD